MSTNSNIAMKKEDGSVVSIYCHWDGYESHHLPILKEHYNTIEKVEALLALGNLSSLDNSCDCPEGHSFENCVDGYCVAYGRDRGEENQQAQKFYNESNWLYEVKQKYNYLFDNNEWRCIKGF